VVLILQRERKSDPIKEQWREIDNVLRRLRPRREKPNGLIERR
jgi:hypothetical protein